MEKTGDIIDAISIGQKRANLFQRIKVNVYLFFYKCSIYQKVFNFIYFGKGFEPVITFAIELDHPGMALDEKNKKKNFLEIPNVESYYNIRTINDTFEIMYHIWL